MTGLNHPQYLAFNSAGVLFVGVLDAGSGNIYEFTTNGVQSTFVTGLTDPEGLAFQGLTLPPAPPVITLQPQPLIINAYGNASFSLTATGTSPLNFQWSFNNTNILGATNSTLTISNVAQYDLGSYAVVVTNTFGSATSSNALLSMYPYLDSPFGGVVINWGQNATLSVGAWGTGPYSYQWYENGVSIPDATNQTYSLPSIQFSSAGLYSVVVSTLLGSVTNTPEQVVVNPAGVSIGMYPGVTVTGTVGYSYTIEATADLSNTNSWVPVTTFTLGQPIQLWVDTNVNALSPANPHKYYKVIPAN